MTLQRDKIILTDKERSLLERLRKIGWGEVTIFLEEGQPQRIVKGIEGEKL